MISEQRQTTARLKLALAAAHTHIHIYQRTNSKHVNKIKG